MSDEPTFFSPNYNEEKGVFPLIQKNASSSWSPLQTQHWRKIQSMEWQSTWDNWYKKSSKKSNQFPMENRRLSIYFMKTLKNSSDILLKRDSLRLSLGILPDMWNFSLKRLMDYSPRKISLCRLIRRLKILISFWISKECTIIANKNLKEKYTARRTKYQQSF